MGTPKSRRHPSHGVPPDSTGIASGGTPPKPPCRPPPPDPPSLPAVPLTGTGDAEALLLLRSLTAAPVQHAGSVLMAAPRALLQAGAAGAGTGAPGPPGPPDPAVLLILGWFPPGPAVRHPVAHLRHRRDAEPGRRRGSTVGTPWWHREGRASPTAPIPAGR